MPADQQSQPAEPAHEPALNVQVDPADVRASLPQGDPQPEGQSDEDAEVSVARLEDRIGAFTAYTIASDFLDLRQIYAGTFERMKEEEWGRRSERRSEGWTRLQALAHVEAVAHMYNASIVAGLEGRPVEVPGLIQRTDLKEANRLAIEARAEQPVADLEASFLAALEESARLAAQLEGEGLGRLVPVPYYGATPTVAELFGASLAHAGVVHGAQLAMARSRPIWIFFQPGMMRRQLTRFFHMFALAYWTERGGDLHATFGFSIQGQGGGSWYIRVGPGGGLGKIGVARTNDVSFWFASADHFCRLMTFQTPIWRAVALRHLRVKGNLRLARRLPSLFMPT